MIRNGSGGGGGVGDRFWDVVKAVFSDLMVSFFVTCRSVELLAVGVDFAAWRWDRT